MSSLRPEGLITLLAELSVWQCLKWAFTLAIVIYFLKEHVFKSKQIMSPEERVRRRYFLVNSEGLRMTQDTERLRFEETLQNTIRNIKVLANEGERKKKMKIRKTVTIFEERNIIYPHE